MPYNHRGREPRPNRLEVRLSDNELARLDGACVQTDKPASVIVRIAIDRYVDSLSGNESNQRYDTPEQRGYTEKPT